jgi:hypothetical protein
VQAVHITYLAEEDMPMNDLNKVADPRRDLDLDLMVSDLHNAVTEPDAKAGEKVTADAPFACGCEGCRGCGCRGCGCRGCEGCRGCGCRGCEGCRGCVGCH